MPHPSLSACEQPHPVSLVSVLTVIALWGKRRVRLEKKPGVGNGSLQLLRIPSHRCRFLRSTLSILLE